MNRIEKSVFKTFIAMNFSFLTNYILGLFFGIAVLIFMYISPPKYFLHLVPIVFVDAILLLMVSSFGFGALLNQWLTWLGRMRDCQKILKKERR